MSMAFQSARAAHLRLGRRGEKLACALLRAKHYDILCRNYCVKAGEIDIVARDGGILVFVEVKTRRHTTSSRPAAGLSARQQRRIYRAGMRYLKEIENPSVIYRFDLIEIIVSSFGIHEVRHWREHFNASKLFSPALT